MGASEYVGCDELLDQCLGIKLFECIFLQSEAFVVSLSKIIIIGARTGPRVVPLFWGVLTTETNWPRGPVLASQKKTTPLLVRELHLLTTRNLATTFFQWT